MLSLKALLGIFIAIISMTSCTTTEKPETVEAKVAPQITRDMKLEDALNAAIEFGGDTARDVRRLITKRKQWPLAEKFLAEAIRDGIIKYDNSQLINVTMTYLSGPVQPSAALFQKLVESGRPLARELAWQMAAALPGKTMRGAIERELNRALLEGEDADILLPQMATAVQSNRMVSAYTLVRRGLLTKGNEEYASAMAVLDPERASFDFIDYLALCPPEELRQMTVTSINVYAATIALQHLIKLAPPEGHPRIEIVFYYAISRNPGLSELGTSLADVLAMKDQRGTAIAMTRIPTWAQIAFIESARRTMNPTRRVFLSELKKISPQAEVAEELSEIQM